MLTLDTYQTGPPVWCHRGFSGGEYVGHSGEGLVDQIRWVLIIDGRRLPALWDRTRQRLDFAPSLGNTPGRPATFLDTGR